MSYCHMCIRVTTRCCWNCTHSPLAKWHTRRFFFYKKKNATDFFVSAWIWGLSITPIVLAFFLSYCVCWPKTDFERACGRCFEKVKKKMRKKKNLISLVFKVCLCGCCPGYGCKMSQMCWFPMFYSSNKFYIKKTPVAVDQLCFFF